MGRSSKPQISLKTMLKAPATQQWALFLFKNHLTFPKFYPVEVSAKRFLSTVNAQKMKQIRKSHPPASHSKIHTP